MLRGTKQLWPLVPAQVPEAGGGSTSLSQRLFLPPCTKNTHVLGIQVKRKEAKHTPAFPLVKQRIKAASTPTALGNGSRMLWKCHRKSSEHPLLGSTQWDAVAGLEFQVFSLSPGLTDREPDTKQGELSVTSSGRASEPPASEQRQQDSHRGLSGVRVHGSRYPKSIRITQVPY